MNEIVFLEQTIEGKIYRSYHVLPSNVAKEIYDRVFRESLEAFPTLSEAHTFIGKV